MPSLTYGVTLLFSQPLPHHKIQISNQQTNTARTTIFWSLHLALHCLLIPHTLNIRQISQHL